jgi:hypothetical protein
MYRHGKRQSIHGSLGRKKPLRVEALEPRHMLSGVVNIVTTGFSPVPVLGGGTVLPADGDLVLLGNGANNYVKITAGTSAAQYVLSGVNSATGDTTTFTLNGAPIGTGSYPSAANINNIKGNIYVWLGFGGNGDNAFDFEGPTIPSGGMAQITIPHNLSIVDQHDANTINNGGIGGNLSVYNNGDWNTSALTIGNSLVLGTTTVDTTDTGGNTSTVITNSTFQGVSGSPAVTINYGPGSNTIKISNNTVIGPVVAAATALTTQLYISNAAGGSDTLLGLGSSSGMTVNGGVRIVNASNPSGSGQANIVAFNGANVLGAVDVTNAGGDNYVTTLASQLGSQLANPAGGAATFENSQGVAGVDAFFSGSASAFPFGLYVDNQNSPPPPTAVKNVTILDNTYIGQTALGLKPLAAISPPTWALIAGAAVSDSFFLHDSSAPDQAIIRNKSVIVGQVDLQGFGTAPQIAIDSSTMSALNIVSTAPGAVVWLGGNTIQSLLNINLGGGGGNQLFLQAAGAQTTPTTPNNPGLAATTITVSGVSQLYYDTPDSALLAGVTLNLNLQKISGVQSAPTWLGASNPSPS